MKIFIGFLLFLLIGCSQNPLKGFGQSDIDIITEIHAKNALEILETLTVKLYKLNPNELNKNKKYNSYGEVILDIFTNPVEIDTTGKKNINMILKSFDVAYKDDRVYILMKGLHGMIKASYNYKESFYITDKKLNPQKLYNSARNIEVLIWRLSNTYNSNGKILLITNTFNNDKKNLSFERLFGKLIANQDILSKSIASQEGRTIQKFAKRIASAIFLPIGI